MKSGHHRVGTSGHLRSEWVVNIDWNEWSKSAGIRTLGFIFFDPIAINNSGRIFGSGFLGMVDNIPESWTRSRNRGHDFGKSCLSSSRPGIIGKELALQRSLIQVRGQRPSQAGIAGPAQIVGNSGVGNQTGGTIAGSVLIDAQNFIEQAALFQGDQVKLIPPQPGEFTSFVTALSDSGMALVTSYDASFQPTYVLYKNGQATPPSTSG